MFFKDSKSVYKVNTATKLELLLNIQQSSSWPEAHIVNKSLITVYYGQNTCFNTNIIGKGVFVT